MGDRDGPVVIVSCGKAKRTYETTAADLYTGPFVQSGLRWARSVAARSDIYILSALYGLVGHDDRIAPYELRLGMQGAVTGRTVSQQAHRLGIFDRKVYVVGGKDYVAMVRQVWPDARAAFGVERGQRSQGAMMQAMKRQAGRLP